ANAERLERGIAALGQDPAATDAPPAQGQQPAGPPAPDVSTQPITVSASTPADGVQTQAGRARRPVRPGRTAQGRARQQRRWRQAQEELSKRQGHNARKRKSKRADEHKMVISPTDSQAALGRDKRGVFRPLYNAQLVADLDSDLILGYDVLAQQNDAGTLGLMLDRTERLVGHGLKQALVDGGYVGGADLAQAEKRGGEILGPLAAEAKTGQLPKSAFAYEASRDVYVCPEGKELARVGQSKQKRSGVELVVLGQYQNRQGACAFCPHKQEC